MNTESFNTSLLDYLTSAVVILDSSFCLFHLNPSAEALFKVSERRSRNSYIGDLLYKPEETLKTLCLSAKAQKCIYCTESTSHSCERNQAISGLLNLFH